MFPVSLGFNHHVNIIALDKSIDKLNRRSKIRHIELALQFFRQIGFLEINQQLCALPVYVDTYTGVRQVDLNARLAIFAATKVQIVQGMLLRALTRLSKTRYGIFNCRHRRLRMQRHYQRTTLHFCVIGQHLIQIHHHPRTRACLNDIGVAQVTLRDILNRLTHRVFCIGKIQCNTRR